MKPSFFLLAPLALSGCLYQALARPADAIGTKDGKPLYETSCEVTPGVVGRRAHIGPNAGKIITPYYACEPVARKTCASGFTLTDLKRGGIRFATDTIQTGTMTTRRTVRLQKITIQFTCNAG
ncbi:hypothetical protein ACN2XU_21240 [Primorskyibacter sp. 2E107]|uniref:hypothetical protein n=1 Tax=Primorskyibacter sp. 2E107 TaxID=3403458 RepID=UPI003AF83E11